MENKEIIEIIRLADFKEYDGNLARIIRKTDFNKCKEFLIETLFPNGLMDHDSEVLRRDLSAYLYRLTENLLKDKNFCRKAEIKNKKSLESYYKTMYGIYIYLRNQPNY